MAGLNRSLWASLACAPVPRPAVSPDWTRDLRQTVRAIRTTLSSAHARNEESLAVATLNTWHEELDTELTRAACGCPREWHRWAWPGTSLDAHLRLRAVLAHLGTTTRQQHAVAYAEMDVAGLLWGACPAGAHLCWHSGKVG